ncbi:hypothetical protein CYY_000882 [Polysphondylium violaceum]|uniref:Homeobox domain-containing protein n=1 Tax=Polysphondylium violaceum TaxID=133409 RepID=A0A8J4V8H8_9MYCE|nr:hypothetical protein CYY_000882 [Polysphondylium violaceum]
MDTPSPQQPSTLHQSGSGPQTSFSGSYCNYDLFTQDTLFDPTFSSMETDNNNELKNNGVATSNININHHNGGNGNMPIFYIQHNTPQQIYQQQQQIHPSQQIYQQMHHIQQQQQQLHHQGSYEQLQQQHHNHNQYELQHIQHQQQQNGIDYNQQQTSPPQHIYTNTSQNIFNNYQQHMSTGISIPNAQQLQQQQFKSNPTDIKQQQPPQQQQQLQAIPNQYVVHNSFSAPAATYSQSYNSYLSRSTPSLFVNTSNLNGGISETDDSFKPVLIHNNNNPSSPSPSSSSYLSMPSSTPVQIIPESNNHNNQINSSGGFHIGTPGTPTSSLANSLLDINLSSSPSSTPSSPIVSSIVKKSGKSSGSSSGSSRKKPTKHDSIENMATMIKSSNLKEGKRSNSSPNLKKQLQLQQIQQQLSLIPQNGDSNLIPQPFNSNENNNDTSFGNDTSIDNNNNGSLSNATLCSPNTQLGVSIPDSPLLFSQSSPSQSPRSVKGKKIQVSTAGGAAVQAIHSPQSLTSPNLSSSHGTLLTPTMSGLSLSASFGQTPFSPPSSQQPPLASSPNLSSSPLLNRSNSFLGMGRLDLQDSCGSIGGGELSPTSSPGLSSSTSNLIQFNSVFSIFSNPEFIKKLRDAFVPLQFNPDESSLEDNIHKLKSVISNLQDNVKKDLSASMMELSSDCQKDVYDDQLSPSVVQKKFTNFNLFRMMMLPDSQNVSIPLPTFHSGYALVGSTDAAYKNQLSHSNSFNQSSDEMFKDNTDNDKDSDDYINSSGDKYVNNVNSNGSDTDHNDSCNNSNNITTQQSNNNNSCNNNNNNVNNENCINGNLNSSGKRSKKILRGDSSNNIVFSPNINANDSNNTPRSNSFDSIKSEDIKNEVISEDNVTINGGNNNNSMLSGSWGVLPPQQYGIIPDYSMGIPPQYLYNTVVNPSSYLYSHNPYAISTTTTSMSMLPPSTSTLLSTSYSCIPPPSSSSSTPTPPPVNHQTPLIPMVDNQQQHLISNSPMLSPMVNDQSMMIPITPPQQQMSSMTSTPPIPSDQQQQQMIASPILNHPPSSPLSSPIQQNNNNNEQSSLSSSTSSTPQSIQKRTLIPPLQIPTTPQQQSLSQPSTPTSANRVTPRIPLIALSALSQARDLANNLNSPNSPGRSPRSPRFSDDGSLSPSSQKKKRRSSFTDNQTKKLNEYFLRLENNNCKYTNEEVQQIASEVSLTDHQVKIFFQNRKARSRPSYNSPRGSSGGSLLSSSTSSTAASTLNLTPPQNPKTMALMNNETSMDSSSPTNSFEDE